MQLFNPLTFNYWPMQHLIYCFLILFIIIYKISLFLLELFFFFWFSCGKLKTVKFLLWNFVISLNAVLVFAFYSTILLARIFRANITIILLSNTIRNQRINAICNKRCMRSNQKNIMDKQISYTMFQLYVMSNTSNNMQEAHTKYKKQINAFLATVAY